MASPTAPTLSTIVSEALKKAGESDPSSALITRAEDYWMEEIKNDIFQQTRDLKFLQIHTHGIAVQGQSRYSLPTDYGEDLTVYLLDGDISGTATAGSINSITLAADTSESESDIQGLDIIVTSGTGVASLGQITAYNSSTKVATVAPDFKVAPASGSTYLIINKEHEVKQRPISQESRYKILSLGRPEYYFPIGDEDYGEIIFSRPPMKSYGIRLRYYADLMSMDLTSTHMATLYKRWRNVWQQGIIYRHFLNEDDDRQTVEYQKYRAELQTLVNQERFGVNLSGMVDHVQDYM